VKSGWMSFVLAASLAASATAFAGGSTEAGPLLAGNILGGAASGVLVGFATGTLVYGLDHNNNPQQILNGAIYGLVGGVVLGSGLAIYEINTQKPDTGYTVFNYVSAGTGLGAALGGIVAVIPFMRDGNGADFTIGLGLGGVIGATLGLVTAAVDIESRSAGGGRLSGQFGIMDVASTLPSLIPEQAAEPVLNCKLVRFSF
jgi:hypothetical protein